MESKIYRLREFISPVDGRSLIVDASAGLSLGALPGLEDFPGAVKPLLPLVDGLVASPGQARRLSGRTRLEGALLARADWTNALRGPDFVLPVEAAGHIPLLEPAEALELGASALVLYFLLGFEEQLEAGCLRQTVHLALQGGQAGLPLLVDLQPVGPRVVLRAQAIQLGVSYALEGGADGVSIHWPGRAALQTILTMASGAPVWIKPERLESAPAELAEGLELGAAGLWLDERIFAEPDPVSTLQRLRSQVHVI